MRLRPAASGSTVVAVQGRLTIGEELVQPFCEFLDSMSDERRRKLNRPSAPNDDERWRDFYRPPADTRGFSVGGAPGHTMRGLLILERPTFALNADGRFHTALEERYATAIEQFDGERPSDKRCGAAYETQLQLLQATLPEWILGQSTFLALFPALEAISDHGLVRLLVATTAGELIHWLAGVPALSARLSKIGRARLARLGNEYLRQLKAADRDLSRDLALPLEQRVAEQRARAARRRRISERLTLLSARLPESGVSQPRKSLEELSDVRLWRLVADTMREISEGYRIVFERRKTRGYLSGDDEISAFLRDQGYELRAIPHLLRRRTLRSAAIHIVANEHGWDPKSLSVRASRGSKALQAASVSGNE